MCTKQEVREVILETRAPTWMRYVMGLLGSGVVLLLGWLLFTVHSQEGYLKDFRTEIVSVMSEIKITTTLNNAMMNGKFETLAVELKNIKETAINRSADRYTGTEAQGINRAIHAKIDARGRLVDERCNQITKRLDVLERAHNGKIHNSRAL